MSFEQLEINKLSETGEVVRKIRCLAGRVTVFRSQSDGELDGYRNALEGRPQKERFSILLDGVSFKAQDHAFIGYSEKYAGDGTISSYEYLVKRGVAPEGVEPTLLAYGLGGLANARFSDLEPWQLKVLRIIGETTAGSRIIALHEPFDGIPDKWREPIAELLTKYAWTRKGIVVVTKLSYRPEHWIENDIVSRVQLERPRSRTIGFGGGDFSSVQAIEQLRKEMGITGGGASPSQSSIQKPEFDLLAVNRGRKGLSVPPTITRNPLFAAVVVGVIILVAGSALMFSRIPGAEMEIVSTGSPDGVASVKREGDLSSSPSTGTDSLQPSVAQVAKREPLKGAHLDHYSPEAKEAWLLAFNQPKRFDASAATRNQVDAPQTQEPAWADANEEGASIEKLYDAVKQP